MLWEGEHRNSFPKSLASPQMPAQPAAMRSFLAISCFGVLWAAPPSVHESQSRSLNSLVLLTEKSFPFLTNRFQGMEVRGCECAHQMMAGATHWGSVPTDPRLSSQLCQELAGGHGRTPAHWVRCEGRHQVQNSWGGVRWHEEARLGLNRTLIWQPLEWRGRGLSP